MIVLAILSVIAAMVVPNLQRSFERNDVQDAARQLQEQVGELQLEASESGSPILVQVSLGAHRLKIWRLPIQKVTSDADVAQLPNSNRLADDLENRLGGQGADALLWQAEERDLQTEVEFHSAPLDGGSADASTANNNDAPSLTGNGSSSTDQARGDRTAGINEIGATADVDWSTPIVIDGKGFQSDRILWLASSRWQAAVLFRSVSGKIEIGPVRSIMQTSESETSVASESAFNETTGSTTDNLLGVP